MEDETIVQKVKRTIGDGVKSVGKMAPVESLKKASKRAREKIHNLTQPDEEGS